jgi:Domain of unknown function (DUF4157)
MWRQADCDAGASESAVNTTVTNIPSTGGSSLDPNVAGEMGQRFGFDFSETRVHHDEGADDACQAINAEAFTQGNHVFFRAGRYDPGSSEGKRLLAHELTHVVQNSATDTGDDLKSNAAGTAWTISSPTDPAEVEAAALSSEVAAGRDVSVRSAPRAHIHRVPNYIVAATFLGQNVQGGVNPVMRTRLQAADTAIQAIFNALPPAQQIHFSTGQPTTNYAEWAGITSVQGWRSSTTSRHGSGSAVDLNYNTNPYIATGTVATPGGEGGAGGGTPAVAGIDDARSRAIEVYQRAVKFIVNDGFDLPNLPQADVRPRQPGETTGAMYDRFRQTSDALRDYLQFAFMAGSPSPGNQVVRAPIPNVETVPEATLLAQIPLTERRDQATAVANLAHFMRGVRPSGIIEFNPWYPLTPDEQYIRMLRDYELVRVPMQFGAVSTSPAVTRNPANGFLDIRREVAIALTDQGLAWLAGDIGAASGDVMHFDIRDHAGFQPGP